MATFTSPVARSGGRTAHREPDRLMAKQEPNAGADAGTAQLLVLINSYADGLLVVTPDDRIEFANPAAEALLGRPARHLVGQPFGLPTSPGEPVEMDLVRPDGAAKVAELRAV